ncbi:death ligand signal enhancer isoform X2 [Chanos chanos]|uniref:Death ligand signal enhancer isoform X2 n=1 Tax=Chanos chanos TaxID=29144 RepID=A0A6J2UQU7_CHACN|nr:death ligand signal enhancer isoform X2 [Chanos chanos]
MWRIHGFVSRVLSRYHGNSQLRLSQGHHVEDEVINSSTVLSSGRHASDSSSQRGEDEDQRKRRRTTRFCYTGLPRYTALDAVGWGAAAVLFMQLCRRIHSQFSTANEQNCPFRQREPGPIQKYGYRILLDILSRRDVLPRGVSCLRGVPDTEEQGSGSSIGSSTGSSGGSSNGSSASRNTSTDGDSTQDFQPTCITPSHQQEEPLPDYSFSCQLPQEEPFSDSSLRQSEIRAEKSTENVTLSPNESVTEAAENLRHVGDSSIPIILNIIGLESVKAGDYETAFCCFLASAQQDYSKAQFNTAVCYEKGHGVDKDHTQALHYYRCAAEAGHRQAQYRCAKLLLNSRGQKSAEDTQTAMTLLHRAAAAGLTEAQLYLGVLLYEDPDSDERKSVKYFRMAAQSGDTKGLCYLGQCYEHGFGVTQCFNTAVGLYQQAAAAGNKQAQNMLRSLHRRQVLRTIRSAPCLSLMDQLHLSAMFPATEVGPNTEHASDWPIQSLPHSWSTGNLRIPPPVTTHAISNDNTHFGWTVGLG